MPAWLFSGEPGFEIDTKYMAEAFDHQGQLGVCPECGMTVRAEFADGEWQWVHLVGCLAEAVR